MEDFKTLMPERIWAGNREDWRRVWDTVAPPDDYVAQVPLEEFVRADTIPGLKMTPLEIEDFCEKLCDIVVDYTADGWDADAAVPDLVLKVEALLGRRRGGEE